MINIKIICVGKLKESFTKSLQDEYVKRLGKYSKIEIIEIDDEKVPSNASKKDEEIIIEKECNKILEKIEKLNKPYIICMDLKGKQYTSEEFSEKISNITTYSSSNIVFVIGGSLGLNEKIKNLSNELISFSKMTFPHQLFRIFLLEQIFRSFKIINNETYHH